MSDNVAENCLKSALAEMSDEQLDAVKQAVLELLENNKKINQVASVLINAKKLYSFARYVLNRELEQLGNSWKDGIEEFIIKAMGEKANEPFYTTDLAKNLSTVMSQFMVEEMQVEQLQARVEAQVARKNFSDYQAIYVENVGVLPPMKFLAKTTNILVCREETAIALSRAIMVASAENISVTLEDNDVLDSDMLVQHELDTVRILGLLSFTETDKKTTITVNNDLVFVRALCNNWHGFATKNTHCTEFLTKELQAIPGFVNCVFIDNVLKSFKLRTTSEDIDLPFDTQLDLLLDAIKNIRRTTMNVSGVVIACLVVPETHKITDVVSRLNEHYSKAISAPSIVVAGI